MKSSLAQIPYRLGWYLPGCLRSTAANPEPGLIGFKEMIYAPKKGGDIESRAHGWRGRAVIERNLDIIYEVFMTEEILQKVMAAAREAGR